MIVDGRSTMEDYQTEVPAIMEAFSSGECDKLLLQILDLERPPSYIDPDLAFWTLNEIKNYVTKLAIICDVHLKAEAEEIAELFRNHGTPVAVFTRLEAARAWIV